MRTLALIVALLATPANAGLLGKSASDVAKLLAQYHGKPVDSLIKAIGYPDRQEPVIDKTAYYWGSDHEDGPVCIIKAVAGQDKLIVDTSAYGNIIGCNAPAKRLKAALTP